MRMSKIFSQTLREVPGEADIPSHQLLLRAGFIRQLAAGIFSYLPLARRSLSRIENIMRQEIEAIGGREITMPVVHPAEIWQETGRWYQIGSEMGRFKDKNGRDMVLSMTHEEVIADLVRKEIRSYRQLPQLLYHIQTKWRDDPRPRGGLIRVREFTMKDSYSLDANWEGLDKQYRAHYQAYFNIFHRCGLSVKAVKSDVGMMGGQMAHEFIYLSPIGEDTLLICDNCGHSANRQIARIYKPSPIKERALPLEKVLTPDTKTIDELASFLGISHKKTAKAVFLIATLAENNETFERFVFAVVRGDMEVNETKLANAVKSINLRPASEEEIWAIGATPGYASPIGLRGALIVVDDLVPVSPNLVAGANEEGFHLLNVNYGRDFQADIVTDIVSAQDGDACPECQSPMHAVRGVEVGNIFKLGTRYSDAMGCYFLDRDGESKPVIMGSYGIGSGRLLACIAEEHHDEHGLVWPITVTPYHVHLIALAGKDRRKQDNANLTQERSGDTYEIASHIYHDLQNTGVDVLFDDRDESPGVKFNDADLIGIPIRITVSRRSLQNGGVEFKRRDSHEKAIWPLDDTRHNVHAEIRKMQAEVAKKNITMEFKD